MNVNRHDCSKFDKFGKVGYMYVLLCIKYPMINTRAPDGANKPERWLNKQTGKPFEQKQGGG